VTITLREMLYSGHVDMMEDARKNIMKRDKEYESYLKQESWVGEGRTLKKRGSFTHLKWLINAPTADSSITADLTFFNWREHKVLIIIIYNHIFLTFFHALHYSHIFLTLYLSVCAISCK